MKKLLSIALLAMIATTAAAQKYMRIWQGGESTRIALQDITYQNGGASFTAAGTTYSTSQVDSITIVKHITVTFSGNTASVDMGNAGTADVTYTANGANVVMTNTNEKEEMEVELKGTSNSGSFTYYGTYKCKIHLNGLSLTSTTGAALDIQDGKRIDLILTDGTDNTLVDAAGGEQKAALYCKGHMEVSGTGNLTVTGNNRHAIATNEYMLIKKNTGTITVSKAVSDAMHIEQYFQMNGGTVNLSGMGGDGIQAELKNNPDEELNGQILIKGGSINIDVTADDAKGIKSDSLITVSGGTFVINAKGAGSKGISAGTDMIINEDDAATTMTIAATGGVYEDPETDDTSKCMGIKVTKDLTISAGTITVTNTGRKSKGIKVDGTYYAKGGTVTANVDAAATRK
ncbi:MAG: carbohydrate-binding domain-containing protein [Bacteroidaceae bacterium]|nr:carbohydrate-binding domain-containing protein [Bacteroidaceae bacterium]